MQMVLWPSWVGAGKNFVLDGSNPRMPRLQDSRQLACCSTGKEKHISACVGLPSRLATAWCVTQTSSARHCNKIQLLAQIHQVGL